MRARTALDSPMPTLDVRELSINYGHAARPLRAVRDVSFTISAGEAYGLIGESGSGKSTIAYAIVRYLQGGRTSGGQILLRGEDILSMSEAKLTEIRGRRVAMVYQEPMTSLNPVLTVGEQIAEILRRHRGMDATAAWARAVELLKDVHLPMPEAIASRYPHQLSGGQQQRVVIAMAIACEPHLLVMDEPTTGLDVTTEAVILDLIAELRRKFDTAILFISHNLGVVSKVCDRVGVLYGGELVEEGDTDMVLNRPSHPYTIGLMDALPSIASTRPSLQTIPGRVPDLRDVPQGCVFNARCAFAQDICRVTAPPLIDIGEGQLNRCHFAKTIVSAKPASEVAESAVTDVSPRPARLRLTAIRKTFPQSGGFGRRGAPVVAVEGVSLEVAPGETLAVVGESGCGKSTIAKCVVGLLEPTSGAMEFDGQDLAAGVRNRSLDVQRELQIVFQNPDSSLNPHHSIRTILSRPLKLYHKLRDAALEARILELMEMVKLDTRYLDSYPRQLSGGQKQRVCIARAFAAGPKLIVCDEPTSALDISVQASILNELGDLQKKFGTSYLFISHDLGVVRHIADRVTIMYLGRVMESGPTAQVFSPPHHPYTEALLSAVPDIAAAGEDRRIRLHGNVPNPANPPSGCLFHTRCPRKLGAICEREAPPQRDLGGGHVSYCHIPPEELSRIQET